MNTSIISRTLLLSTLGLCAVACADVDEPTSDVSAETDSGSEMPGNPENPQTDGGSTGSTPDDDDNGQTESGAPPDDDDADPPEESEGESSTGDASESSSEESGEAPDLEAVCGDGIVHIDEVCDDGLNVGETEGDCATDCSAVVLRKQIVLSDDRTNGRFGDGSLSVVNFADAHCQDGHKAMFVYGDERVATIEPHDGDGQVDWVLEPWTEYVNADGERIWTTQSIALLGVDENGNWAGLDHPIADAGTDAWTGMRDDYTAHDITCSDWTEDDPFGSLVEGSNGLASATDQNVVGTDRDFGRGYCFFEHSFFCAEQ